MAAAHAAAAICRPSGASFFFTCLYLGLTPQAKYMSRLWRSRSSSHASQPWAPHPVIPTERATRASGGIYGLGLGLLNFPQIPRLALLPRDDNQEGPSHRQEKSRGAATNKLGHQPLPTSDGEAALERSDCIGIHEREGINPSPTKITAKTRLLTFVGATRAARTLGRTTGGSTARRGARATTG